MSGLRINVLTAGDSRDVRTWSNLPYFVTHALEESGVQVNRINFIPDESRLYRLYRRLDELANTIRHRLTGRQRYYDFYRDRLSVHLANRKIRHALRRAPPADFNLFLTFSFSSCRYSDTPVLHYCDLTYAMLLESRGRQPGLRHRFYTEAERRNIGCAAHVFTTGRHCCDAIRETYGIENVHTLTPGINLVSTAVPDADDILQAKRASHDLLFIGKGFHKRGVDILLQAFAQFSAAQQAAWTLHVVGFTAAELGNPPANVVAHGMLDKGDPDDLAHYLGLLKTARLFVMPMREGPLPGVIREAMLMYTPVVITDIWNASDRVEDGVTGTLVADADAGQFASALEALVADEQRWASMALRAHDWAGRFGWERTIEQMLSIAQGK